MIIIFPYAKPLRNNSQLHPKHYPYWQLLVALLQEFAEVIQVGAGNEEQIPGITDFRKNLSLTELAELVDKCSTWISVDSFSQHFCWDLGKKGIVLWGQSDPNIFGHPENINLLRSRDFLRKNQFWIWEQAIYNPDAFVTPDKVIAVLKQNFKSYEK